MRVILSALAAGLLALPAVAPAQPTVATLYDVWGCDQPGVVTPPRSAMCLAGDVQVRYGPTFGNDVFFSGLSGLRYGTITPGGNYIYNFAGAKLTTATLHFTNGSTIDLVPLVAQASCLATLPFWENPPAGFYYSCDFTNVPTMHFPGGPLVVSYVDVVALIDEGNLGNQVDAGPRGLQRQIGTRSFRSTVDRVSTFALVAPEPATLALVGGGLLVLGGVSGVRRRRV